MNTAIAARDGHLYRAKPEWLGQECFVVCGGESVRSLDLSRLRGRPTIVINDSVYSVPHADFLVFSDRRWWDLHRMRVLGSFAGRIVTVTPMRPSADYLLMERVRSGGLSPRPDHLAVWHTSVCPATNLGVHLGVSAINYLGLDGKGGWHHEPHPWKQTSKKFEYHGMALRALVQPLRDHGVRAYNANPDSAYDFFPHRSYEEMTR